MTNVMFATSNFLVPNGTFIVVLLAFLVVVWVIGKKVLPVLNKVLTERQDQIRGELEAADKAKSDAEEADVERRAALEQGDDGGPVRDREEGAVLLHDAAPSRRHGAPPALPAPSSSSPMTRSTPLTRSTAWWRRSSSMVASRSPSRATWVRKISRASSARPSCSMARMETSWSPKIFATEASTPGRSATSMLR